MKRSTLQAGILSGALVFAIIGGKVYFLARELEEQGLPFPRFLFAILIASFAAGFVLGALLNYYLDYRKVRFIHFTQQRTA